MPSPQDHLVNIIAGIPLTMEDWQDDIAEQPSGYKTETEMLVDEMFGETKHPEPITEEEFARLEHMFGKARVGQWRGNLTDRWYYRHESIAQLRALSLLNLGPEVGQVYDERHRKMMERKAKRGSNPCYGPMSLRSHRDKAYETIKPGEHIEYQRVELEEPRTWVRAQVMSVMLSCEMLFFPEGIDSMSSTVDTITDNVLRRLDGGSFESSTAKIELEAVERLNSLNAMRGMDEDEVGKGHTKPWLSVKQWKEEKTSVKAALAKDWNL